MELERPPTRRPPGVPTPSTSSHSCVPAGPASPLRLFEANHDAFVHGSRVENSSTSPHLLPASAAKAVLSRELQSRQEAIDRREAALQYSEQLFQERVAMWETRCRLWEAQYAERLAELDARESCLGQPSTGPCT
ncbi:hypothetical protein LSCM1_03443 [Leishmania martiniquensis]|uniref:Uncharacterized protein n=1 Tax=Leishmania martiniquensis TaxID=1580590 RepID=A0A836HEE2_9TRYP|nr:hypothetical protein LSCM1_03443 [Leishmania martiniquensis]